jgi:hypothetical protein
MLQIDDFEPHQSWRIDAVAGMWEVPSHSNGAGAPVLRTSAPLIGALSDSNLEC